ncbi:hypothetical protein J7E97_01550 [Streptomyces sp. ISL-66]|uniref:hypothetical protein n=1 Tax=Streptomyces sp. ISL-66 TaxID=2819186 RepID=UPI001BE78A40|nr:hypothetical protein [Streptomyces sp. ISL-66]MBT2466581.1 hypothetical protein [Streptomyces sp. ISL-66]
MIPAAARAVIAAHLTDELDVHPHRATAVVAALADRLAIDGWHINDEPPARPVAPRARETRGARRALDRLLRRARPDGGTTP